MVKKSIWIFVVFTFIGCGPGPQTSPQARDLAAAEPQPVPGGPSDPTPGTPPPVEAEPTPVPPVRENDPLQVCFLPTASGQTCFDIFPRKDVHSAEPLYNYVNSFTDPNFPAGMDEWQYRSPTHLLFSSQHLLSAPLSQNFVRDEVLNSNDTRGHYGVFSPAVLLKIQQLREKLGKPMIINSGYRSPGYNATLVGAAKFSRHTFGDAIDFKVPGVSLKTLANRCLEMGAGFYQIYATHVHCDWRTTPLNESMFGKDLRPTVHLSSFSDLQESLAQNLTIQVEELVEEKRNDKVGQTLRLQASTVLQEDPGRVQHEWQVTSPDGQILKTSEAEKPVFKLPPGDYIVWLSWGGSLETSTPLTVK
jgi:hypothetical protein